MWLRWLQKWICDCDDHKNELLNNCDCYKNMWLYNFFQKVLKLCDDFIIVF